MKIVIIILSCIGIISGASKSIPKQNITITGGNRNDSYNGSITPNRDDHRTFSFYSSLRSYNWNGDILYSALTKRSRKDTTKAGRLDELLFTGERIILRRKSEDLHFTLSGIAGAALSGNLGGEDIQNRLHEGNDEPLLYLPYEYDFRGTALFGTEVKADISVVDSLFTVTPSVKTWYAPTYRYSLEALMSFRIGNSVDYLSLGLGGELNRYSDTETGDAVGDQESGVCIRYDQKLGIFSHGYNVWLNSGYSTGHIGLHYTINKETKQYKKADIIYELNLLLNRGGWAHKYRIPLSFKRFNWTVNHMFGTYTGSKLPNHPAARGQYLQVDAGGEFRLFPLEKEFQWNLYAGAGAGIKNESIFSGDDPTVKTDHYATPLCYVDAGVSIGGPIQFLGENVLYDFHLGNKLTMPFIEKEVSLYDDSVTFGSLSNQVYFGFACAVDF